MRHNNPQIEKDWQEENIDGIRYIWVKTKEYHGNGAARAFGMFQFVLKIMLHSRKLCEKIRPDTVIASSTYPMDGYAARRIRKISGAKYIHEIHDMWPATLIELGGMSKRHPFVILNQMAENSFCKYADAVISIPPCTKEYLMKHGMAGGKFHHIPNGIVKEDWENVGEIPAAHEKTIDRLKHEGRFIIAFAGSHNEAYGLTYLVDAVKRIKTNRIAVVFVGDGYIKEQLINETKDMKDIFYFLPPISKTAIPSFLRRADALYVAGTADELFRFGISMNKLTDALMAGKPILYAVNAPNNYIEEYECGISIPPRDSDALGDAICSLLDMSEEARKRMGENGHKAALEHFEYQTLADKFIELMKER